MCGENHIERLLIYVPVGSPPRVRGKPRDALETRVHAGITPACAGKTSCSPCVTNAFEDHPRVCGENRLKRLPTGSGTGSPPRVRGKPHRGDDHRGSDGITPACAGKTQEKQDRSAQSEDHPRVCGENAGCGRSLQRVVGSPPRVRGKRGLVPLSLDTLRITPACAGKTFAGRVAGACQKDHPRVCGENAIAKVKQNMKEGSPPRVRGKHCVTVYIDDAGRITPACAGKTYVDGADLQQIRDHPRVCGENPVCVSEFPRALGSPPRVRGKPGVLRNDSMKERITPACAGKTSPLYCRHPE